MYWRIACLVFGGLLALNGLWAQGSATAEGAIIAFQAQTRHPVKLEGRGIADYVERWILRIDHWVAPASGPRFIRVDYILYERGLNDGEINTPKLMFKLRPPTENEPNACSGRVLNSWKKPYSTRKGRSTDFQRTAAAGDEPVPEYYSLPCFVAEKPPAVVRDGDPQ